MSAMFDRFFNTKPGKGISQDEVAAEREKVTFSGFFKIYKRKFWQITQLNFLTAIFFIPVIYVFVVFVSQLIIPAPKFSIDIGSGSESYSALWSTMNIMSNNLIGNQIMFDDAINRIIIGIFFTAVPLIAIGPIQAGFTYILQSFIRERPVFLTHDLFKKAKSNFFQSLFVSVIDIIFTGLIIISIYFYRVQMEESGSIIWTIGLAFMLIAFAVYMIMHLYMYPIMVTFNVSLRQLYKNSFFLAMTSFFPGLLILLIDAAIIYLLYYFLAGNLQILLVLAVGLIYSTIGLINNYFSFKYIKFYLLDPALVAAGEKNKVSE